MPGTIVSFDVATQTATVSPSIRRINIKTGEVLEIPDIITVPVVYPSAGGYSITFPVMAGDEVLLLFSERAIGNWIASGGKTTPQNTTMHNYTDAVALIGLHSNPNALTAYATDGLVLRNDSNGTKIKLTATAVTVDISPSGGATFKADGAVEFTNGTKFNADKSVLFSNGAQITALGVFISASGKNSDTHTHGGVATGTSSTGVPQ